MKNLFALLVLVLGLATSVTAQTEKTLTKSVDLASTHTAFVLLPGDVVVNEWDEDFIRVTTTLDVKNMSENIVKRLVIVGRYSIETKTDKYGKMMVIKMPNVKNFVAVRGVDLVESYSFEIQAPEGYRVIVKDDLNPNVNNKESLLRETL